MEDFSSRLRKCAESRGLNQAEVARDLNLPAGSVSRYFTGASMPKSLELLALAKYFGVSMEWILTGEFAKSEENRVSEEAVVYSVSRKRWMSEVLAELEAATDKIKERLGEEGGPDRS